MLGQRGARGGRAWPLLRGHLAQEETRATRTGLLTLDSIWGKEGVHAQRGPQKSRTFHGAGLEVWPGAVCLKMKLDLILRSCIQHLLCTRPCLGTFNTQDLIKSHNKLKRPVVTFFILQKMLVAQRAKFSNVTQLAPGVEI